MIHLRLRYVYEIAKDVQVGHVFLFHIKLTYDDCVLGEVPDLDMTRTKSTDLYGIPTAIALPVGDKVIMRIFLFIHGNHVTHSIQH